VKPRQYASVYQRGKAKGTANFLRPQIRKKWTRTRAGAVLASARYFAPSRPDSGDPGRYGGNTRSGEPFDRNGPEIPNPSCFLLRPTAGQMKIRAFVNLPESKRQQYSVTSHILRRGRWVYNDERGMEGPREPDPKSPIPSGSKLLGRLAPLWAILPHAATKGSREPLFPSFARR
jgi:hypothetical protein